MRASREGADRTSDSDFGGRRFVKARLTPGAARYALATACPDLLQASRHPPKWPQGTTAPESRRRCRRGGAISLGFMANSLAKSLFHNAGVLAVSLGVGCVGVAIDHLLRLPRFPGVAAAVIGGVLLAAGFAL